MASGGTELPVATNGTDLPANESENAFVIGVVVGVILLILFSWALVTTCAKVCCKFPLFRSFRSKYGATDTTDRGDALQSSADESRDPLTVELLEQLDKIERSRDFTNVRRLKDIGGRKFKKMFEAKLVPKASSPINSEELSPTTEEITVLPPSTTDVLLSYVPATELCRLVLPKVPEKVESVDQTALEGAKNEHPYHAYQMETEDLVALNSLLRKLRGDTTEFPNLFPVEEVMYFPDVNKFLIVEPLVTEGSLKDKIFGNSFRQAWEEKYQEKGTPLDPFEAATYARTVLQVLIRFRWLHKIAYGKDGKHVKTAAIGHVQTGNIFLKNGQVHVGGYVLGFLGYKTRLHKLFKKYPEHIDVLMLGHLLFEMAAGYELTTTEPTANDYTAIENADTCEVLQKIFRYNPYQSRWERLKFWKNRGEILSLKEVAALDFFSCVPDKIRFALDEDEKKLLAKIQPQPT